MIRPASIFSRLAANDAPQAPCADQQQDNDDTPNFMAGLQHVHLFSFSPTPLPRLILAPTGKERDGRQCCGSATCSLFQQSFTAQLASQVNDGLGVDLRNARFGDV